MATSAMEFDVTPVSWFRRQHRNRIALTLMSALFGTLSALFLIVYAARVLVPAIRTGAFDSDL